MAVNIQVRHDTAANWTSVNPVLMLSELGFETDTKKLKIGNGVSTWSSLEYWGSGGGGGSGVTSVVGLSGVVTGANIVSDAAVVAALAAATAAAQTTSVQKTANLSDVADTTTARTNLGLGSAATHAAADFDTAGAATAAQAAARSASTPLPSVVNISAAGNLALDTLVLADATSAAFTTSLPVAAGNAGHRIRVKKIDAATNAIAINVLSSGTINGVSSVALTFQWQELEFTSDGTEWKIEPVLITMDVVSGNVISQSPIGTIDQNGKFIGCIGKFSTLSQLNTVDTARLSPEGAFGIVTGVGLCFLDSTGTTFSQIIPIGAMP